MKRSNIDAMICKQEGITEITRDEIHRMQLEKLNIVLKKEKEREGFYRDLPERLESLTDLRSLPFYNRNRSGTRWRQDAALLPGGSTESDIRTDKRNYRCR